MIDPVGRDVWMDAQPLALTRTEFDLLAALAQRPRMEFSRRQLIDAVWGLAWVGDEHLVDVHVAHLRRKLGDDATQSRFVRTIRGAPLANIDAHLEPSRTACASSIKRPWQ